MKREFVVTTWKSVFMILPNPHRLFADSAVNRYKFSADSLVLHLLYLNAFEANHTAVQNNYKNKTGRMNMCPSPLTQIAV